MDYLYLNLYLGAFVYGVGVIVFLLMIPLTDDLLRILGYEIDDSHE